MVKQVIILRKDLGMRKGKMIAQGAHASLAAILNTGLIRDTYVDIPLEDLAVRKWITGSFTKIVVSVNSEEQLLSCYHRAFEAGFPCALITDAGRTEFHGIPTHTAVAIGPAESNDIDLITGELPLL